MNVSLHLFDDQQARRWEPMALTRPVGSLLFGALRMYERGERVLGIPCASLLAGEALRGFQEPGSPPALLPADLPDEGNRVLLLSRAVPHGSLPSGWDDPGGTTLLMQDQVVGWVLPPGVPLPAPEALLDPPSARFAGVERILPGRVLQRPWDLVEGNAERIAADIHHLLPPLPDGPKGQDGVHVLGTHLVQLGAGVEMEPGVVLDVREGPIRFEAGVRIRAFTRVEGPAWFGPGCILQGGVLTHVGAGPRCRLRGEIEASLIQGWSNKAHDGYLGHAWLGSWVNLGALTTNSDLKNNYGSVRLRTQDGEVDSGLMKLGCFLGDHVKTGIGTLLNTGTVVGAGSNVFGGAMPPNRVPAFSWGSGTDLTTHRVDRFLETARRAMSRRDIPLTEGMVRVLSNAFRESEGDRQGAGMTPPQEASSASRVGYGQGSSAP